jgi:hypothetical protein
MIMGNDFNINSSVLRVYINYQHRMDKCVELKSYSS